MLSIKTDEERRERNNIENSQKAQPAERQHVKSRLLVKKSEPSV